MIRATSVLAAGAWSGAPVDRVTLRFDERHRRRIAMQAQNGLTFLLDLPEAAALRHGDGLLLADGRVVEVQAEPEPLLEVRGRDPQHLARLAWHLGNRHLPAAIGPDRILIRPDHVITGMLIGLGAEVSAVEAPFDPEAGAYSPDRHDHHHGGSASRQHAGPAHG